MRQTVLLHNVTRSGKLWGAQRSPEFALRSTNFCSPENLIFPALWLFSSKCINSLFREEINACAAVHTCYVMDTWDRVQSIIFLSPMMGMSFLLVVLTRLIVREPKHWVTWSHGTGMNFPFLRKKRIQCFSVSA